MIQYILFFIQIVCVSVCLPASPYVETKAMPQTGNKIYLSFFISTLLKAKHG